MFGNSEKSNTAGKFFKGIPLALLHMYRHKSSGRGGDVGEGRGVNAMKVAVKKEQGSGAGEDTNAHDSRKANIQLCFIITYKFAEEVHTFTFT